MKGRTYVSFFLGAEVLVLKSYSDIACRCDTLSWYVLVLLSI